MHVANALRRGSASSVHWRIEGFSGDSYNALYVSYLAVNAHAQSLPYHFLCVLDNEDEDLKMLFAASYPTTSETTVHESTIEDIARRTSSHLEAWAKHRDVPSLLESITMGSRFHVDSNNNCGETGIWLCPNNELERRYLALPRLQQLWEPLSLDMPPILQLEDLRSIRRLHDSVSVVLLPDGRQAVFKGAVRVVARMYHELRELLRLPSHPNVIAKPSYIVTRQTRNRTKPIVCGFILPYHSGGSLVDRLKCNTSDGSLALSLETKVKWIFQLASALLHIHNCEEGFYSDLRLDNIVITEENDLVLVDLEQCGSARRWLHPEAWPDPPRDEQRLTWAESPINPAHMPRGIFYSNPPSGYFKPFTRATDTERQMMENYSLAKVMWCIFEEQTNEKVLLDLFAEGEGNAKPGSPQQSGVCVFPNFHKTPWRMRYWIWLCTRVSAEWGDAACKCSVEGSPVCGMTGSRIQEGKEVGPGLLETWKYLQATFIAEHRRAH